MKRIVYPFITFLVTLGLVLPGLAATYPFSDVDRKHPAYQEIYVLSKNNILNGVTYERFGGELDFKRFDLADSLITLLGNRQVPSNVYTIIADVQPGSDKYKTVSKIIQANLIELQENKFQGLRPVTRYELMQSLQRLLNFMGANPPLPRDKELKFRDVATEYKDDVQQVTNVWQITEGYPDGLFRGDNRVTRYEAAIMLAKVASTLYEDFKIQMKEPVPIPRLNIDNPVETPSGNPVINTQPTGKPTLEDLLKNRATPSPTATGNTKPLPSVVPTSPPTVKPSVKPTTAPPTAKPSTAPTAKPVVKPTPVSQPSSGSLSELEKLLQGKPSTTPKPTTPSTSPSGSSAPNFDNVNISDIFGAPKVKPSEAPSASPTVKPSAKPSAKPTAKPSAKPTVKPSTKPSVKPTAKPSAKPTVKPSVKPSSKPTAKPTVSPPTAKPTEQPVVKPSAAANIVPSNKPTPLGSDLSDLEKRLLDLRSSPTPKPSEAPLISVKPAQPETLTKTPLPTPTPRVVSSPEITPSALPELPEIRIKRSRPALDSRMLLYGNYRALYEERVPPGILQALAMDSNSQSISGDAGVSGNLSSLFWFGEPNTALGNLGLGLDIASMGGIKFNGSDLTDLFWADMSILYKVVNTPPFDLAMGLSGYYRLTESSNDPRNNYFQASRSYIGAGARMTAAYRIVDPLSIEFTVSPHYVIQDLSNILLPNQLPLNRFDTQIQFLINWDIIEFGNSKLSLNAGYQGLLLLDLSSDASQMMHGVIFGTGYHF